MSELEKICEKRQFKVSVGSVKFEYNPAKHPDDETKYNKFLYNYRDRVFPSDICPVRDFFHAAKVSGMDEVFAEEFYRASERTKLKALGMMAVVTAASYLWTQAVGEDFKLLGTIVAAPFWLLGTLRFVYADFAKFVFNKDLRK